MHSYEKDIASHDIYKEYLIHSVISNMLINDTHILLFFICYVFFMHNLFIFSQAVYVTFIQLFYYNTSVVLHNQNIYSK